LVKLIPSEKVNKRFLGILVESNVYKEFIQIIAGGSAQPNANAKDLTLFKFFLPPLPTQQRIASILSAYDDLIEVNNQRIKLLEQTARELYKEWFVRMRFPGYKQAKFVKGIPEDWEVKKLGDVIELAYGKALKEENREGGKFPVYGSSGIVGYHTSFISNAPGIVVGRKGNVGTVFWVTENFYAIDTAFYVKTSFSKYYVYFNLFNQHFIEADAAVPGLNRNQAYSNFILLPDDKLIKSFEKIVQPIFHQINILQNTNTQLRLIRDRLLPRLISGKLQVKETKNQNTVMA
jgi:type I restriction enzyme S subunit